jgi:hypothetical protein
VNPDRSPGALGLLIGGLGPIVVAAALVPLRDTLGNTNVALILVVIVVLAAVAGGRAAGALAAVMTALSFDFFHTEPYLSLTIASSEDVETTLLLLAVGLIVGQVAQRAQRSREAAEAGHSEIGRIHRMAEMSALGQDPAAVLAAAQTELTTLLGLAGCRFEAPPFSAGRARLERSGTISGRVNVRASGRGFELPQEGVELAVLAHGREVGRFILDPTPGVGVTLEQRIVAVAIADQVGAALSAGPVRQKDGG